MLVLLSGQFVRQLDAVKLNGPVAVMPSWAIIMLAKWSKPYTALGSELRRRELSGVEEWLVMKWLISPEALEPMITIGTVQGERVDITIRSAGLDGWIWALDDWAMAVDVNDTLVVFDMFSDSIRFNMPRDEGAPIHCHIESVGNTAVLRIRTRISTFSPESITVHHVFDVFSDRVRVIDLSSRN